MSGVSFEVQPNMDASGIRYGYTHGNRVCPHFLDFLGSRHWTDLDFEPWKEEAIGELLRNSPNLSEAAAAEEFDSLNLVDNYPGGTRWEFDGPVFWEFDDATDIDLRLVVRYDSNDNSIVVLKSPFVMPCRLCSPCCPNGGDLTRPDDNGYLAYCLPPEDHIFGDEVYVKLLKEVKR